MKTLEIADRLEIDVLRPNGTTETVVHPSLKTITAKDFSAMKAATAKAGRGELLAYRCILKTVADTVATDASYIADKRYIAERNAISRVSATGR